MKDIAHLLNEMTDTGVITSYALFGALAQIRYTEPEPPSRSPRSPAATA